MQIRLTRQARQNIDSVYDYISIDSIQNAQLVLKRIEAAIGRLAQFPRMGHTGRVKGTHEIVVDKYPFIIVYQIHAPYIDVLTIIHSRRQWS